MMALTLRLSDEDTALLRAQAAIEERSMNDVAILAIRERAVRHDRAETDRGAVARLIERHAGTLELLAR
jgi:uncharacterized protein (DUF1778 family)